ncbi:peptidoglycan bridge formation glycyltransferase FemA/FemB family protein, partial [Oenococcus oeni]|uniref:peptidoglycan bridge formation glycyltransferase FemA/FemB family protein n=1 Tax=Oenococcus oeni TaxID=1247 RepID=UPI000B273F51
AKHDIVLVSVALFVIENQEVVYLYSGSDEKYEHLFAPYEIQDTMITEAVKERIPIFFGSAEGLTIKQIAEDFDHDIDTSMVDGAIGYGDTIKKYGFDGLMDLFKKNDPLSLAENADEFNSRLQHGLNMIRQNYEIGDNVLVVTHGSLMRALANKYKSPELASKSLSNGAVSKLTFEAKKDGDVTIDLWNDTEKVW